MISCDWLLWIHISALAILAMFFNWALLMKVEGPKNKVDLLEILYLVVMFWVGPFHNYHIEYFQKIHLIFGPRNLCNPKPNLVPGSCTIVSVVFLLKDT